MHTVGDSRADLFDCFYFNLNGDGKFVGVVLIGFGRIEDWRYYSPGTGNAGGRLQGDGTGDFY